MKKTLKSIKSGRYAIVARPDKDGNLRTIQLHYNPLRHKFYLAEDKRGVTRQSITAKVASKMLRHTMEINKLTRQ